MDRVTAVEYRRAAPRERLAALAATLLALAALAIGAAPAMLWAPAALLGAPLAALGALALFTLPGLAALRLLHPAPLPLGERLCLALSLSCAAPPLLLLAAEPIGLRWGPALCWAVVALCALLAAWPARGEPWSGPWRRLAAVRPDRADALLLIISLGALAVRLFVVRDLDVGLWGDSYHHTMIVQLMADNGGMFRSWEPYAPLQTLTYHFGFHAIGAWLHWLTGLEVPRAVVANGQILSAAAAPLAYLLTVRLGASRRAGLWAALIAGFLALMPAHYVNWGRYTQLAGQTALPAACVAWAALIDRAAAPGAGWRDLARPAGLATLALTAVFLCHYRIGAFAACFVAAYGLYALAARVRSWPQLGRLVGAGLVSGAAALLLTLPWLLRMREGLLLAYAGHLASTNIGTESANYYSWAEAELALRHGLLPLAALGIVAILATRSWRLLVLPGWAALLWLAANPFLIGLNGSGLISGFAVLLGAYLAAAPLGGIGLAWLGGLAGALAARLRWPAALAHGAQILAAAALLAWGSGAQARVVDLNHQYVTAADAAAAAWLRERTPDGARVFVNSFGSYDGSVYVGTDGGWWLPLLSGRRTNVEPITYGMEAGPTPDYYQRVMELNRSLSARPLADPASAAALKAAGFSYIYDGPTANPPAEPIVPAELAGSPLYEQVYSQGGVTIWRVR